MLRVAPTRARAGGRADEGIAAFARSLEHLHLGWALLGLFIRLPGVRPVLQLLVLEHELLERRELHLLDERVMLELGKVLRLLVLLAVQLRERLVLTPRRAWQLLHLQR